METKLSNPEDTGDVLSEKKERWGMRKTGSDTTRENPAKGRGKFRTLDGKHLRERPLIGGRDSKYERKAWIRNIRELNVNYKKQLEEVDRTKEERELDPQEIIDSNKKPIYSDNVDEYNEERTSQDHNEIKGTPSRSESLDVGDKIRKDNALEAKVQQQKRKAPLSKVERRVEERFKQIDTFGRERRPKKTTGYKKVHR